MRAKAPIPEPSASQAPRRSTGFRVGRAVFITVVTLIAAATMLGAVLDGFGDRWVACKVTSTEVLQGNNRAGAPWRVAIHTEGGGTLSLLATTREGAKLEASALPSGAVREFRLGTASQLAAQVPWLSVNPSVKEIRTPSDSTSESSSPDNSPPNPERTH